MVYSGNDIIEQIIIEELARLKRENDLLKSMIREGTENIRCAVCGRVIPSLSIQRLTRPHLWHDRKCFQWKPRKIIALQNDFGKDIVDILKETTKRCGSIEAQCNLLGVSIPYLYSIIKKYCGKNWIEFMAENASGKRKELYEKKLVKIRKEQSED